MSIQSIDRTSLCSVARMSLILVLTVLMAFPDGVALAQTACNNTNPPGQWYLPPTTSTNQYLPVPIETFAAAVTTLSGSPYLYVLGGNHNVSENNQTYQSTVPYAELGTTNGSVTFSTTPYSLWGTPVQLARDLCGATYTADGNTYIYSVGGRIQTGT